MVGTAVLCQVEVNTLYLQRYCHIKGVAGWVNNMLQYLHLRGGERRREEEGEEGRGRRRRRGEEEGRGGERRRGEEKGRGGGRRGGERRRGGEGERRKSRARRITTYFYFFTIP